MTTTIGGVTLDKDPVWVDKFKDKDLNMKKYRAVDGTMIIVTASKGADYPFTLTSSRRTGWLKGSTITSLRALSAVATTYTLNLNSTNYTVMFDNERIAIDMTYLHADGISAPDGDTWYFGNINLLYMGA